MQKSKALAVIIPAYNVEDYIEQSIMSVIDQSNGNISVICVDDGSTDRTGDILDSLASKYSDVHTIHQSNGGVSNARNTGLRYAQKSTPTDYIMFLDGDDIWFPGCVEKMLPELNKSFDIVLFDGCQANEALCRRSESNHKFLGTATGGKEAYSKGYTYLGAEAYSAKMLKDSELLFHEGQRYGEDIDFLLEARYIANKCLFTNILMYIYRTRNNSAVHTRRSAVLHYTEIISGLLKSYNYLAQKGIDCPDAYGAAVYYLSDMVMDHFREHGSRQEISDCLYKFNDIIEAADVPPPQMAIPSIFVPV